MSGIFSAGGAGNVGVSGFYPVTINDSLRFDRASSTYLNRTPSSGNRRTWTWSSWVKRGNLGTFQSLFAATTELASNNSNFYIVFYNDQLFVENYTYASGTNFSLTTNAVFRDVSAFYHIVLAVDTTQSTSSNRVKLYVNGEQVTSFSSSTYPSQNYEGFVNSTYKHKIGNAFIASTAYGLDGYLSDIYFIDGTALDPTSFGEAKDGTWIPKSYSGSYGTNGFHLEFNGNSNDTSGNSNNWTANNISAHDYVPDTPTNNWCTLNSIYGNGDSISEGNLKGEGDSGSAVFQGWTSTFAMSSGKWYWEVNALDVNVIMQIGVHPTGAAIDTSTNLSYHTDAMIYNSGGTKAIGTGGLGDAPTTKTTTSYGASYTDGDIIGVALDLDSGTTTLTFYKNNSSQGTAFSNLASDEYTALYTGISDSFGIFNFGQDSSFAGTKTAQGNTDANGNGDFYYAPPSGFLALCSANLPEPTIIDGSEYFNTVLWTGNSTNNTAITGVGFQSDFVWIKQRNGVEWHRLHDTVRGVSQQLYSNDPYAESTTTNNLLSVNSDGFTLGTDSAVNGSGYTYVGWNWKAGTSFSNSAGTNGATIASSGSVNTDAGFSIVSYVGTGSAGTVYHGLSSTPEFITIKDRDYPTGRPWGSYHFKLNNGVNPEDERIQLNEYTGETNDTFIFNSTAPTSNVFSLGTSSWNNTSGNDIIAYCFHSVEGYSKIGQYIGNYNVDGPFVYTGFKPAFILIKSAVTTGYSWYMMDSTRTAYNGSQAWLSPDLTNTEDTSTGENVDILSNGFKIRTNWTRLNDSGSPRYIYIAFAENPFKYANAR